MSETSQKKFDFPKQCKYVLRLILSLSIIWLFLMLGELVSMVLPFPRSLLGMLLLFISLASGIIKLEWIQPSGNLILTYMALFFIPPAVDIIKYRTEVMDNLPIIAINVAVGIILIIFCVGHCFQILNRNKKEEIK